MLLPWILVLFTVSDAFQVYQQASTRGELYCVGFGFLWGIGSILFGLGVDMVGNALGFAIILVKSKCRPSRSEQSFVSPALILLFLAVNRD